MKKQLKVLITGSSTGFGRLLAQTLAKSGHIVFATMRDTEGKNADHAKALRQWSETNGSKLNVVELDVTSDESVQKGIANILKQTEGVLDVVVNNAGVYGSGLQETYTVNDYKHLFEVNVFGSIRINNAVLPTLRKQGSGLIIQVTSVLGRLVIPFQGVYHATKWAAEVLAENLHYELAPLGIESVIVQPGPFKTEIFSKFYQPENAALGSEYGATTTYMQQFSQTLTQMMSAENFPNEPQQVADAIQELIEMSPGTKPLRTVVDKTMNGTTEIINTTALQVQAGLLGALGLGDLLNTKIKSPEIYSN